MNDVTGKGEQRDERPPLVAPWRPPVAEHAASGLDGLIPALKLERPDAYNRLYGLMADRLFRAAFRLLQDRQEAEDAVQQAFLELIKAGCPPEEGRSLEAWLHTSIRFTCIDQIRRRERRPSTSVPELPEVDVEDDYWLGFDPQLEAALASLTPTQRLVVYLKHVEGLDGRNIGEIVGVNRVAVYAMAARAERRLGRLMTSSIGTPRSEGG